MSESDDRSSPVPGLDTLYDNREPPASLEDDVVDRLERTVWGRDRAGWPWPARVAAGLVLFAAGWGVGTAGPTGPEATAGAQTYMLMLWEGPDFGGGVPPGTFADEYASWLIELDRGGTAITGEELALDAQLVPPAAGAPQTTPRPPGTPRVGGYFLVSAEDAGEALRIAESHPHRTHGGWIEVRPVVTR